jgi:hypothetical protein
MPRPDTSFPTVADVPLHYDRLPGQYGTRGQPRPFFMTAAFHSKLEACFAELWDLCPLGQAEVIATAGAWVEKPGAHGAGRAFDLDAIFWPERTFVTLHYPNDRGVYLAVEAVLRRSFGTVLNHEYNAAHHDHFHVDDLTAVGFVRQHRSRVLFVQMALRDLFGRPIAVDGRWGPQSAGATAAVLHRHGLGEANDPSNAAEVADLLAAAWLPFLLIVARAGFAELQAPDAVLSPADLLREVHAVLQREVGDTPARPKIEAALVAFAEHPQVASVLT